MDGKVNNSKQILPAPASNKQGPASRQIDVDILQAKKDVRRARDAMSPSKKKLETQNLPATRMADLSDPARPAGRDSQDSKLKIQSVGASQQETEIPKFDLAEEIMAQQRRITAARRKAPGKKPIPDQVQEIELQEQEIKIESTSYIASQPMPVSPEQGQIIAEIVARDIEKLCQSGVDK